MIPRNLPERGIKYFDEFASDNKGKQLLKDRQREMWENNCTGADATVYIAVRYKGASKPLNEYLILVKTQRELYNLIDWADFYISDRLPDGRVAAGMEMPAAKFWFKPLSEKEFYPGGEGWGELRDYERQTDGIVKYINRFYTGAGKVDLDA